MAADVSNLPEKPLSLSSATLEPSTLKPPKLKPKLFPRKQEHSTTYVRQLNKAIRANVRGKEHNFTVEYQKKDGERVVRKIKPIAAGKDFVKAWDHSRNGVRTFSLSRINALHKEASALPSPFTRSFLEAALW
jgi:predicted DNA-binding transcriptional regulator YafY